MICVSLAEPTVAACLRALEGLDFAEIRLDKMRVGVGGVRKLFSAHPRLIATCRPGGEVAADRHGEGAGRPKPYQGPVTTTERALEHSPAAASEAKRLRLLLAAIEAGAAYVDIELESDARFKEQVIRAARLAECRVIVSYHNFERTPSRAELEEKIEMAFAAGADIAKIACRVRTQRDNARLLGLLDSGRSLVIVGMGKKGGLTRVAAPLLGSAFTYASLGKGKETADGQFDAVSLERILLELKRHARA